MIQWCIALSQSIYYNTYMIYVPGFVVLYYVIAAGLLVLYEFMTSLPPDYDTGTGGIVW